MSLFAHNYDFKKKTKKKTLFKPPVNGEWIVHVGESVSLDMILYQVLQERSLF